MLFRSYKNEEHVGQAIRSKIADGTVKREDIFYTSKVLCVLCVHMCVSDCVQVTGNRISSCLVNGAYCYNFFHTYLYIKSNILLHQTILSHQIKNVIIPFSSSVCSNFNFKLVTCFSAPIPEQCDLVWANESD